MGYQSFAGAPKQVVKSEDIGPGQINLSHLSPSLYTEIRKIALHSHSGQGSRRIDVNSLTGVWNFYYMKSPDGTTWKVTMSDEGVLTVTEM